MVDVNGYIATTHKGLAGLEGGNVIAATSTGPTPLSDAKSYAYDYTRATDEETYVYEVNLRLVGKYRIDKQVVFGPSE